MDSATIRVTDLAENQKTILLNVYKALEEKGYDPIRQITGYLVTEDPAYITNYKGARAAATKLDRDLLLAFMLEQYIGHTPAGL